MYCNSNHSENGEPYIIKHHVDKKHVEFVNVHGSVLLVELSITHTTTTAKHVLQNNYGTAPQKKVECPSEGVVQVGKYMHTAVAQQETIYIYIYIYINIYIFVHMCTCCLT